ncbi:hypothetical protein IBE34_04430, partial [Francisella philomiragia]|uniref:hypothetical protein n=3 Tax=Francisella philomiragia TaxID=28110 RepID=UPI0019043D2D
YFRSNIYEAWARLSQFANDNNTVWGFFSDTTRFDSVEKDEYPALLNMIALPQLEVDSQKEQYSAKAMLPKLLQTESDIKIKTESYLTAIVDITSVTPKTGHSPSNMLDIGNRKKAILGYPLKARTQEINSDNGDLIKEKDITIEKSDIEEALYEMIMSFANYLVESDLMSNFEEAYKYVVSSFISESDRQSYVTVYTRVRLEGDTVSLPNTLVSDKISVKATELEENYDKLFYNDKKAVRKISDLEIFAKADIVKFREKLISKLNVKDKPNLETLDDEGIKKFINECVFDMAIGERLRYWSDLSRSKDGYYGKKLRVKEIIF